MVQPLILPHSVLGVPLRRMPHVSDRGLRYVLQRLSKGNRAAAATYLADRCSSEKRAGAALRELEQEAEAFERREEESRLKTQLQRRKAEEDKKKTDVELEALKKKIVGRYADQVGLKMLRRRKSLQKEGDGKCDAISSLAKKSTRDI